MFKVFSLILGLFIGIASLADEPVMNLKHSISKTGWWWILSKNQGLQLTLSSNQGKSYYYDISECMFCSGEEDNCNQNGIFPITLLGNEPILGVVCHQGAHSQQLQILAPLRNAEQAVFSVTGDYWVDYQLTPKGIQIYYDRRPEENNSSPKRETFWPQQN